jgi:hypothetical protein
MGSHKRFNPPVSTWEMAPNRWLYLIHAKGHGFGPHPYASRREAALAARQEANRIGFARLKDAARVAGRKDRGAPAWRKHTKPSAATLLAGMGVRPVARPARRRWARR